MSHRVAQVQSTLKRAICAVLQRQVSDPRIDGMVSVTRIEVSPDLRNAYVYVSVVPQNKQSKTIHGLRRATRHIQKLASRQITLRTMPHLEFRLDESLKKEAQVMQAIQQGLVRTAQNQAEQADVSEHDQQPESHEP